MTDRVTGLKNILWAIGIVVCLLALFVGCIVAAVTPYHGEADPRTPDLNAVRDQNSSTDVSALTFVEPDGQLHALLETKDAGADYLRDSVFLTDSVLLVLREQSLTGGDVWSSDSGSLPMDSIASWSILYSDGSKISPADACMIAKPARLFIAIGSDALAKVSKDAFISGYAGLIRSILALSPDTKIVCCAIAPVTADYDPVDDLDNGKTADGTDWVKELCLDTGAYYADTASVLSVGSDLNPKYANEDGRTLNTDGAQRVLEYLRTHAIPSV
ncbi:MAG: SGNH/GDSL hydrolase family protein [Oscillospiraceae bacterium]|nr:SGNH/GDSL hydrolase family protein [Oscillospiraceae bacterium]